MKAGENDYYYAHDHLYSLAVLADSSGTVIERYEYDAYGKPTIWNAGLTTERDSSNYGNPYLFTGRRVDILDSGSLKIQYNRNRYYDYYTGRWLTHDPLGITPNPQRPNKFNMIEQYKDGLSLYGYVRGDPVNKLDQFGLLLWMPPILPFPNPLDPGPIFSCQVEMLTGKRSKCPCPECECVWVETSCRIKVYVDPPICQSDIEGRYCDAPGTSSFRFICKDREIIQMWNTVMKPCYRKIITRETKKQYEVNYGCTHQNTWQKTGERYLGTVKTKDSKKEFVKSLECKKKA